MSDDPVSAVSRMTQEAAPPIIRRLGWNAAYLLPAQIPDGAALPVLAMPIVNQHALTALVLYGAHTNSTLLDPDEVELLPPAAPDCASGSREG